MKTRRGILAALLGGMVCLPVTSAAVELSFASLGQAFTGSPAPAGMEAQPAAEGVAAAALVTADSPDSSLFAEGTRAIDESRWADAVKLFTQVANQHGDHADGALYWKAYAENKLGHARPSEAACAELRKGYPKSRWLDDCGALLVEIRAKSGKPVEIEPGQSDDVKLLALNAMMRQDEPRALAEIQAILNGDASEKLKKEAQFILGKHYSNVTYAQVVRVSYVEGDVRIQRGDPGGKAGGATWEKAAADLPLETGFSLVTGAGRAEVEFENASTLYLGENSVLTFNDLHETAGIPYTEVALLSGTVSLYIHPYVAGEKFVLHTPTNDLVARYPDKDYARIESFTDAVSITPLEGGDLHLPGVTKDAVQPGRTWTYRQGRLWVEEGAADEEAFSAWDKWAADRVAQRNAAINAVMEASGLTEPIPGMAEMEGQGKFFDCAPYGTCWEPADEAGEDEAAIQSPNPHPSQQVGFQLASYRLPRQAAQPSPAPPPVVSEPEFSFPCTPLALRYRVVKDPATGKQTVVAGVAVQPEPYDWAVCHAGSWIRHKRHYVWVAGGRRRHIDPVRWVRNGHQVGFIPLHPFDVKGQPAINARHGFFAVGGKDQFLVQHVKFDLSRPVEFLKSPPREYRNSPMLPLKLAEAPHMEAHVFPHAPANKTTVVSRAAIPIHFDPKSQSFMVAREEMR
ncbi:MAG TPA: hypothetical protein VN776_10140, partial [Terracidiphilus sp.]|nr:hypothetical protein [Terracidiphilus sp.]